MSVNQICRSVSTLNTGLVPGALELLNVNVLTVKGAYVLTS
jgi:hypothetical protein